MRFFRTLDFIIITVISVLFLSGFSIYVINQPAKPSFSIKDVVFELNEENRSMEFYITVERGKIELKEIFIDNVILPKWSAEKLLITRGEKTRVTFEYKWSMSRDYIIKVVTIDDRYAESSVRSPQILPSLGFNLTSANVTSSLNSLSAEATYTANGTGIDSLQVLLFTYLSYEKSDRPIYMFYDSYFMTSESLRRADSIIQYFSRYDIIINKADYKQLEVISKINANIVLILVNPLKEGGGRRLQNAVPAPLVDPDKDGFIRDDSKYGKTHLYDWMKDGGLILVTVGSTQPHKRIIYEDGVYGRPRDSDGLFDAHLFLTDASGNESIMNGSFTIGDYTPIRISGALGLPYREASYGFDKDAMERYGLEYYAYGDYELDHQDGMLNLTLPVFIRVGEGGWLAMGDEELWLGEEQLAHDLFMIYMQAVWDSEWIPYGWYWDSGSAYHDSPGVLRVNESLRTELVPSNLIEDEIVVKLVGIAYSQDLEKGILVEQRIDYEIP